MRDARYHLFLVLANAFWAGNFVVGGLIADSVSPLFLTMVRWVLATVPLFVLAALIEKKGGPTAVMGDNDALVELLRFRPATALDQDKRSGGGRDGTETHNGHPEGSDLAAVKQELFDSPESAVKKNLEAFERKFDLQKTLQDNLGKTIRHEGDRVIKAVTAGPHDRIIDPVRSAVSYNRRT